VASTRKKKPGARTTPAPAAVLQPERTSAGLLTQHLPLALTALVFVMVFARLLAVSNYDAVTARAVLANAGPTQVVLGSLFTSLPALLPIIAIGLPTLFRLRTRGGGPLGQVGWSVTFALLLATAFVITQTSLYTRPWWSLAVSLGIALVLGLTVEAFLRRQIANDTTGQLADRPWLAEDVGLATVLLLNLLVVTGSEPWLPAEKIELRTGDPVVGYVLDETDDQLVVLENDDRRVSRLELTDVTSREICRLTQPALDRERYADCPD